MEVELDVQETNLRLEGKQKGIFIFLNVSII